MSEMVPTTRPGSGSRDGKVEDPGGEQGERSGSRSNATSSKRPAQLASSTIGPLAASRRWGAGEQRMINWLAKQPLRARPWTTSTIRHFLGATSWPP